MPLLYAKGGPITQRVHSAPMRVQTNQHLDPHFYVIWARANVARTLQHKMVGTLHFVDRRQ